MKEKITSKRLERDLEMFSYDDELGILRWGMSVDPRLAPGGRATAETMSVQHAWALTSSLTWTDDRCDVPGQVVAFARSLEAAGAPARWVSMLAAAVKPGAVAPREPLIRALAAVFAWEFQDTAIHNALAGIGGYMESDLDRARLNALCTQACWPEYLSALQKELLKDMRTSPAAEAAGMLAADLDMSNHSYLGLSRLGPLLTDDWVAAAATRAVIANLSEPEPPLPIHTRED